MWPRLLSATLLAALGGGCGLAVTRPKLEMGMAAAALMAAKDAEAEKSALPLYRKAEYYYLKAKSAYRRKYFNRAQKMAQMSIKFSERAELISAIKKDEP